MHEPGCTLTAESSCFSIPRSIYTFIMDQVNIAAIPLWKSRCWVGFEHFIGRRRGDESQELVERIWRRSEDFRTCRSDHIQRESQIRGKDVEAALRLSSKKWAYGHYFWRKRSFQRQIRFCSSVAILSKLSWCHLWKPGCYVKMDAIIILRSFPPQNSRWLLTGIQGRVLQCLQAAFRALLSWGVSQALLLKNIPLSVTLPPPHFLLETGFVPGTHAQRLHLCLVRAHSFPALRVLWAAMCKPVSKVFARFLFESRPIYWIPHRWGAIKLQKHLADHQWKQEVPGASYTYIHGK